MQDGLKDAESVPPYCGLLYIVLKIIFEADTVGCVSCRKLLPLEGPIFPLKNLTKRPPDSATDMVAPPSGCC